MTLDSGCSIMTSSSVQVANMTKVMAALSMYKYCSVLCLYWSETRSHVIIIIMTSCFSALDTARSNMASTAPSGLPSHRLVTLRKHPIWRRHNVQDDGRSLSWIFSLKTAITSGVVEGERHYTTGHYFRILPFHAKFAENRQFAADLFQYGVRPPS